MAWRSLRSRAASGSSSRSADGLFTSARASATRCCWPPESCDGRRLAKSLMRTISSISPTDSVTHVLRAPSGCAARTRRCRTRSCAGTARTAGRPCSRCAGTAACGTRPRPRGGCGPRVGDSNPAIIRSVVVLPQPDGPEHREELAAADREVGVVHRDEVAEPLRRRGRARSPGRRRCLAFGGHRDPSPPTESVARPSDRNRIRRVRFRKRVIHRPTV